MQDCLCSNKDFIIVFENDVVKVSPNAGDKKKQEDIYNSLCEEVKGFQAIVIK